MSFLLTEGLYWLARSCIHSVGGICFLLFVFVSLDYLHFLELCLCRVAGCEIPIQVCLSIYISQEEPKLQVAVHGIRPSSNIQPLFPPITLHIHISYIHSLFRHPQYVSGSAEKLGTVDEQLKSLEYAFAGKIPASMPNL